MKSQTMAWLLLAVINGLFWLIALFYRDPRHKRDNLWMATAMSVAVAVFGIIILIN